MHELVQLNVGGTHFATTLSTLQGAPESMLGAMFSGAGGDAGWQPTLLQDEQGRYFIDRDGKHFGKILNFLRDGSCIMPPTAESRRELLKEADFYGLPGLVRAIEDHGKSSARTNFYSELLKSVRDYANSVRGFDGCTRKERLSALSVQLQAATLCQMDAAVRALSEA